MKWAPFYERIAYQFRDEHLLERALTHRSVLGQDNNERLEFLGDAILGCIIAHELYQRQPEAEEGRLSRMRAALVNGEVLAKLAISLDLGEYVKLAPNEASSGGRERHSILADALEALIGALFLDGGLELCRDRVLTWYGEEFSDLSTLEPQKDPKSALQEWTQAKKFPLPHYKVRISGKGHEQFFHVSCRIAGLPHETLGESNSRRKAEKIAAEKLLDILNANTE